MKKVLLLPMMLMGVALSFTSCGDNDDPGKDPDVVTYDFKNLPADSGAKPTEDQMSAVVATFVDEVALPTYKDMLTKMTAYKNAVDKFIASGSKNDLADACDAWRAVRVPWEQSEAFLFGVADLAQLDPSYRRIQQDFRSCRRRCGRWSSKFTWIPYGGKDVILRRRAS